MLLFLLLINGIIGFVEGKKKTLYQQINEIHKQNKKNIDRNAAKAVDALRAVLAPMANVKRDGEWKRLAAREIVPGDAISVKLGGRRRG